MAIPVQFILVIPRDYPPYMNWADAERVVGQWIERLRNWFIREIGHGFDIDYRALYSSYTIYQLSGGPLDGCAKAPVPEGQGIANWGVFWRLVQGELGLTSDPFKRIAVCIGAGGWAGGASFDSSGFALLGDWGLRYAVTGQPDPCCVDIWSPAFCSGDGFGAFGHEVLHAFWVDCHNPVVWGGDPLSEQQKNDLLTRNALFLYPAISLVCTPGSYKTICTLSPCGPDFCAREVYQCRADGSAWEFKYSECPWDYSCGRCVSPPPPPPPPPPETWYRCVEGICEANPSGAYSSLEECQELCFFIPPNNHVPTPSTNWLLIAGLAGVATLVGIGLAMATPEEAAQSP